MFYDIEEWHKMYVNTTGTRDKFIAISPEGKEYYFKTSLRKVKDGVVKEYPLEFWSEIVASQLGNMLKLPVLQYDVASNENVLGCISENMADVDEELTEGVRVIAKVEPSFLINENFKKMHTLALVQKGLATYGISKFQRLAIEMQLFDCIIGNTDRHSENWAVIRNKKQENINSILFTHLTMWDYLSFIFCEKKRKNWLRKKKERDNIYHYYLTNFQSTKKEVQELIRKNTYRFAPFYDNGSSLGRELNEQRICNMLKEDSVLFEKYFNNGCPDIKVKDKKTTFNDTIIYLLQKHPEECSHFIRRHLHFYDKKLFSDVICHIDDNLPNEGFDKYRLSQQRKDFYIKIIDSRIEFLQTNIPHL